MKNIILDLDTGIDDTLAIAYALGNPEAKLIGITGTYGNVTVDQGVRNALAVTELFGHPEVPVYRGIDHPEAKETFAVSQGSAFIHGANGVGDVDIPDAKRSAESEPAVDFIIDAAKTYGKELTYVPTGAMTNIAAALRRAPEIRNLIGDIVLMGGALTVPGNVNAWTEANISQDPEAADYLFRSGVRTEMIGLDVTMQTLLTRAETAQWRELGTPAGRFLADMTDYYIAAYEKTAPGLGGCGLHDPLAVATAIDPTLVATLPINLKVELDGPTRGRTIGDYDRLNDPFKTTSVAIAVNKSRFLDDFMRRVTSVATASAGQDGEDVRAQA
ncbi:nucleoside hydrolase [Bifidobacterium sp. 82T10]|uniref:Nucleoside hydrolase n=1 Tax=Bifidobacterium miconis TaxID=2834435 RepID=A0ABS6WD99_9BIFI|nr:nucleoside hydrolase [Bifidobacterium miconis]MBW3092015.1 nucleoside hydrolase [Bifidobacterium miconis]